jgi:hypothetical protein
MIAPCRHPASACQCTLPAPRRRSRALVDALLAPALPGPGSSPLRLRAACKTPLDFSRALPTPVSWQPLGGEDEGSTKEQMSMKSYGMGRWAKTRTSRDPRNWGKFASSEESGKAPLVTDRSAMRRP